MCTLGSGNCGSYLGNLPIRLDLRLYTKFPRYRSGTDLLAVEFPELFITGLTSGEPILGDMVMDEGGDTTLLSS